MRVLLEREQGFNVFTYGAVGDGTIDDYAAIQRAIDAACTAAVRGYGGVVVFPPFLYKWTQTLTVYESGVRLAGVTRNGARGQFNPDSVLYPTSATGILFQATSGALLYSGISDIELRAASDAARVKTMIDVHGGRHFSMRRVVVSACADTSRASIGLKIRGWDASTYRELKITANYPLVIGKNDDLDPNKDLDHVWIENCEFVADNAEKRAIKFEDGVAHRDLTLAKHAWVQGGLGMVDTTAPRRKSINLHISDVRVEGLAETAGSVDGIYALDIQKHENGKLENAVISNVMLGEGSDARFGNDVGAAWNGLRSNAIRTDTHAVEYSGTATGRTVTGRLIESGCRWTHEDNGRAVPESEAQWDVLGIARPRSWWRMNAASGSLNDRQDATVSGLPDRSLAANGAPLYQQFVTGWHGYHTGFTEAVDQRFGLSSGLTDFNPNDRSATWLLYVSFPTGWVPGGDRVLLTMGSAAVAGAGGPVVYIGADGKLKTYAGSTVVTGSTSYLGKSIAILGCFNRTAGSWITYAAQVGSTAIETITGTYAGAVGSVNAKGLGAPDATFTTALCSMRFAAMWFNTDAESLDADTLRAMGWGL